MTEHTPGPWTVDAFNCIWAPDENTGVLVANARNSKVPEYATPNSEQRSANAALIAAAPETAAERDRLREINAELLKVAKWAAGPGKGMTDAQVKEEFRDDAAHLIVSARAAIAKAESNG